MAITDETAPPDQDSESYTRSVRDSCRMQARSSLSQCNRAMQLNGVSIALHRFEEVLLFRKPAFENELPRHVNNLAIGNRFHYPTKPVKIKGNT